ncbi:MULTISPECIES: helix-turn-helix domain-containing protein [Streptomyces]|uniref:helix-turn-helix domain-containing protein n=1 Tax=Streptomyces TaxID=1883 RepID=UPI002D219377|nr:helix-turn-helix domain-containing protein [Streptomyces baarnensis]
MHQALFAQFCGANVPGPSDAAAARARSTAVLEGVTAQGATSSAIASDLRVSGHSVQRWRRMWDEGGPRALRSRGPASLPRLSEKQFARLRPREISAPPLQTPRRPMETPHGTPRRPSSPSPAASSAGGASRTVLWALNASYGLLREHWLPGFRAARDGVRVNALHWRSGTQCS